MARQPVSPPPVQSPVANSGGPPAPTWARWFHQMWDGLHGGWIPARPIVASSISTTTDFGSLAVGDVVVVLPASAGNSHFLAVTADHTLPEAAVVGSLYLVLRAF